MIERKPARLCMEFYGVFLYDFKEVILYSYICKRFDCSSEFE